MKYQTKDGKQFVTAADAVSHAITTTPGAPDVDIILEPGDEGYEAPIIEERRPVTLDDLLAVKEIFDNSPLPIVEAPAAPIAPAAPAEPPAAPTAPAAPAEPPAAPVKKMNHFAKQAAVKKYKALVEAGDTAEAIKECLASDEKGYTEDEQKQIFEAVYAAE